MLDYEAYKEGVKKNKNASIFARDSYTQRVLPIKSDDPVYRGFNSPYGVNPDLDTPQGLYEMARRAGLEEDAQRVIQRSGGESQKFMSGGAIMDAMDILSAGQYGLAGLIKGKGFMEGVKNRESFADDDALGQYGWTGRVAGFALDVVLDPLNFVPPAKAAKLLGKIPGVTKSAELAKSKLIGELTTINVDGQKLAVREGGWSPLDFLGSKLVYGFAADPKFLEGYERINGRWDAMAGEMDELVGAFSKLKPEVMRDTIARDETGRFISANLTELQRKYSPEEMKDIQTLYQTRDSLMERLVDLGVISKETSEEHWGTYLKQTYDEYLDAKNAVNGKRGIGITNKSRVKELTPEKMKELGQVEDASVIWGTTLLKQIDLVKKAELQKLVSENFSISAEQLAKYQAEGGKIADLVPVPDAPAYRLRGKEIDLNKQLGSLNKQIKNILKQRKAAFKDNKEILSTISKIEGRMDSLLRMSEDNLSEALSGVKRLIRESSTTLGPMKKAPTSEGQKALADSIQKFLKSGSKSDRLAREALSSKELLQEFLKTREGIALEYAFEDPRLMYQWNNKEEFFDAVRRPDRAIVFKEAVDDVVELSEGQQNLRIKKAEEYAKEYGDLQNRLEIFKGTNLKLIEDVVNKIEDDFADKLFQKKNVLNALEENKFGQLAGKYVTKETWDMLRGTFEPTRELGESLVLKFKHLKVVWNPASQVRNAVGASIQNWWKIGIGPWRVDTYIDAQRELKNKGKIYQQMVELGFNERSGQIAELVDNYMSRKMIGDSVKRQLGGSREAALKAIKHIDRTLTNSYGHMDNVAKVAAFKYGLKKGLSPEEALKKAYEATFNYSQVTPFVHQMRRAIWGVPFITFAIKAAPLVASTVANNPGRISVFGKARNALFDAAGIREEQEAEALPDYMRDSQFVMRLPWKDERGRSMYFDMAYIVPFGAIMSGEFLRNPEQLNPVVQTIKELSQNKTFSGNKIFLESDPVDKVLADISMHLFKIALPPPLLNQIPDGYNQDGERDWRGFAAPGVRNIDDAGPNERTFYQEVFRNIGFGVTPYDLDSRERSLAFKQKEQLTQLLSQKEIIQEFRNPYLPKDSEFRATPLEDRIYDKENSSFTR